MTMPTTAKPRKKKAKLTGVNKIRDYQIRTYGHAHRGYNLPEERRLMIQLVKFMDAMKTMIETYRESGMDEAEKEYICRCLGCYLHLLGEWYGLIECDLIPEDWEAMAEAEEVYDFACRAAVEAEGI